MGCSGATSAAPILRPLCVLLFGAIALSIVTPGSRAAEPASGLRGLSTGSGQFDFAVDKDDPGKTITVWYHRPETVGAGAPVVFVIHGASRNGEDYRDDWIAHAERGNFLLITPEFSQDHFPGSWRFGIGNVFRATGDRKPEAVWAFTVVENLFDRLRAENGVRTRQYDLYGHSAGGQFVHRMVLFKPNNRIRIAVAANAGWYTMVDESVAVPYGLKGAMVGMDRLRDALGSQLVVLLGMDDDDPYHRSLRRDDEAMLQGRHRLARGQAFFRSGEAKSDALGIPFRWRLAFVPDVGHSNRGMARSAVKFVGRNADR